MQPTTHGNREQRQALIASHTPEAVQARLRDGGQPSYVRDLIYGAMDGVVTTFAVVAGAAGAGLSARVAIIMGFANLFADGVSMAAGNYLGTRTENQERRRARRTEEQQIDVYPQGEREEVRQIFAAKGFSGEALDTAVAVISADRERWIRTMLTEEYGLSLHARSPIRAGLMTFGAFVIAGSIPLMSFLAMRLLPSARLDPFVGSCMATALTFFCIGAARAPITRTTWWRSGAEALLVGATTAATSFAVGQLLGHLVEP